MAPMQDGGIARVWPLGGSLVSVVSPEGGTVWERELFSVIDVQERLHGCVKDNRSSGKHRVYLSEQWCN